jgi:hypothetical protein
MNRWLQSKQFVCPKCKAVYTHDKAYRHEQFECPHRHQARPAPGEARHPPAPAPRATGGRVNGNQRR